MQIRGRAIGPSHPPYVIAEVSCNHAGSEAVAMALIQVAKDAGAAAVKFQFYTPEGMVGDGFADAPIGVVDGTPVVGLQDRVIEGGPWANQSMWELYDRSQMPWGWGPRLKQRCHDLGLAFIASAYDREGLDWLYEHCPPDAFKVASFEATDTPFVLAVAGTDAPIIISTGMMAWKDRQALYGTLQHYSPDGDVLFLHCVSAYPTPPRGVLWEEEFGGITHGFSDHTLGHAVACAAVAKGACVLEKHIQLHPALKTADSHFSATPDEFALYCQSVKAAWEACQPVHGDPEKDSRQFRRAPGGKRGSYAG